MTRTSPLGTAHGTRGADDSAASDEPRSEVAPPLRGLSMRPPSHRSFLGDLTEFSDAVIE